MSDLHNPVVNMQDLYFFLIVEWFIIFLTWVYLVQVVPSSWGVKKHPLFFLGYGKEAIDVVPAEEMQLTQDVKEEAEKVTSGNEFAIRVKNFRKVYPTEGHWNSSKVAVEGITFGVNEHTCFGILGPNGAGKKAQRRSLTHVRKDNTHSYVDRIDSSYNWYSYNTWTRSPQ